MNSNRRFSINRIICLVIIILSIHSCDKGNLPPVAKLTIFPPVGDTSILFEFNAAQSEDDRSYAIGLVFRWDTNGDGVWDSGFEKDNTSAHKFLVPGNYLVRMEVKDLDGLTAIALDTVEVFGVNADTGRFQDPRDGNVYRTVRIGGSWWMAENLRFGKLIPNSREQTDNDTVERYRFTDWKECDTVGGVYSWFEAMNYNVDNPKGICPDGWHIPSHAEWNKLYQAFPMSYAHKYFGKEGLSGLNLDISNSGYQCEDLFHENFYDGGFWTTSYVLSPTVYNVCRIMFSKSDDVYLYGEYWENFRSVTANRCVIYNSLRCKKDF
jgi:uncharacterized protein (TIGR02145 family)